jgi:hypothetical protein
MSVLSRGAGEGCDMGWGSIRPKNQWQDNSIIMCYEQCFQCNIGKDASEWLYFSLDLMGV